MTTQLGLTESDLAPTVRTGSDMLIFAPDLSYQRMSIVNVVFYGNPSEGDGWILVDTGLLTSARSIIDAAEHRFGRNTRPAAIVMTHGHFDHVGSLEALLKRWEVPVYAHQLELPYLSGEASYPPADAHAGGGLMTLVSPLYPRSPVDVRPWLKPLPTDQHVPGMPGWQWVHTPGHTPGHVSLWRGSDRTLIAGDAIVTTGQESIYEVLMQTPEIHGPPRYFTPDWKEAERSVKKLAALEPELVISGHGPPVRGGNMRMRLHELARDFESVAVPARLR